MSGLVKLAPKLRMFRNGDDTVNTLRAEQAAAMAVQSAKLLDAVDRRREPDQRPEDRKRVRRRSLKGKMAEKDIPSDIAVNVFLELREGIEEIPPKLEKMLQTKGKTAASGNAPQRKQNLVMATVPLNRLEEILEDDDVVMIEAGEQLTFSPPVTSTTKAKAPLKTERRFGSATHHKHGANVLIGIVDVQGFDFSHPDFLDENGETRFLEIWDQGLEGGPAPQPFGFGTVLTRERLNRAIASVDEFRLPAHLLERQSQMATGSHGTHVASIAAGNRGVCQKAKIAAVTISLPAADGDRRKSFYDSTRLAQAIEYLFQVGQRENLPVSINVSLGTNGHAHDASSAVSRWVDWGLASPGRSVCVAAGNAGQEAPERRGDIGFVMGRIHTSGELTGAGLTRNIEWIVIGDGIADLSENELELWYSPQDRFAVQLKPPGSSKWIGPVEPGEFIENQELASGTFVSIYNELYYPANGDNYIAIYLSPTFSREAVIGIAGGTWTVRLIGREVRDGRYDGWIERDDPRRQGPLGASQAWSFPSFFAESSNVDKSSVSSFACGHRIISVANLDAREERINITSSQGPTRDGRRKPDIAAPGTDIVAANGFARQDEPWTGKTGTSMASPFVAGLVGLMLSTDRTLTAAQIRGILRRTAKPLPSHDFRWRDDSGFGQIDPEEALEEVRTINRRKDVTP